MGSTAIDRAKRFLTKHRNIFLVLSVILVVQLLLALKVILIIDNAPSCPPSSPPPIPTVGILSEPKSKSHLGATSEESKVPSQSSWSPRCEITNRDAISAIRRATTGHCKEYLANMTCLIATDNFYPKRLSRSCRREDTTYMKHIGCYQDDKSNRLLRGSYLLLKETNSPQTCVDACLQSGFPYAGVQYSVECFCGTVKPTVPQIPNSALCSMKCPVTDDVMGTVTTCGGYFVIDVYETGVNRELEVTQGSVDFRQASATASDREPARVVFFLTLNGRALRQVRRLIKNLFHARHYFYIHVDARQDYLFRELLSLEHRLPGNVRFMRHRLSTIWGGASLLQVLLQGMTDLVTNSGTWGWTWDYVVNLSESDFPLKTISDLETFLSLNSGSNFLKSHGRDVQNFIMKQGLDKTFVECEHRMWRLGERKLPSGILIDGGSDWIALHRTFVQYVVTKDDPLVTGLLTIFDHTLLPAESFFHILLRNSAHCRTFVDNNLHVTNWKRKLGCKCQYKSIVDWCGCSPNDFRLSDWSRLTDLSNKMLFFGRKFEAVVNQGVINQLESHLYPDLPHTHETSSTLNSYWQSVYHHHDLSPKPDDALLTVGSSLARLSASKLPLGLSHHLPSNTSMEEVSVYVENDRVAGILVRYSTENGIQAESFYRFQNFVSFEPWSFEIDEYHAKIQHLAVGSDYDQKEQIFRNFANSLGPLTEPTLSYHVYADRRLNLTFVWTNPLGSVQAVQNFSIDIGITANFAKPALKIPLVPGNWTVKILSDTGHLLASSLFMVTVTEFYHALPISFEQNKILNGISTDSDKGSDWTATKLHSIIDSQTARFYNLQATCLLTKVNLIEPTAENSFEQSDDISTLVNPCAQTFWSSAYPDPKSTIAGIHPKTGRLVP